MYKSISGAAFFSRGFDTVIIREDLLSQNEPRQLAALKQIIAYMTMGKDMSGLFNEVATLAPSTDVVIKRLVYFYLMQNSRIQPEKAVLQAGTFVKDTLHDSPLIRGAALRTMTNLQVSVMADFAVGPIRRCLDDSDAYVRRIAVFAVLKQYHVSSAVFFEYGLIEKLKELLNDPNVAVVGACVQVMMELHSRNAPGNLLESIVKARPHLVSLLEKSTEWTAFYLLEGIALSYRTDLLPVARQLDDDATTFVRNGEEVMMRTLPFVFYANQATMMAAIKTATLFLLAASKYSGVSAAVRGRLEERFAPCLTRALISQLEAPRYEYRFVALRNIQLYIDTRLKKYFKAHLGAFLIQFADPIYIKLEKLDALVALADDAIGSQVLSELIVYARESDVELVARSINAIGLLATTLPSLAGDCVQQLEMLVSTRVPHIVESACIVVQRILRCYPNTHLGIIARLCEALSVVNDGKAMASIVWVVGEYTDSVPNAAEYLNIFLENFMDQPRVVRLGVLSALIKMYLGGPRSVPAPVVLTALEKVLSLCVNSVLPDLRDRAIFYWRLLALDIVTARKMFAAEKRVPLVPSHSTERKMHEGLLDHLGTLESVVHLPVRAILGPSAVGGTAYGAVDTHTSDDDDDDAAVANGAYDWHDSPTASEAAVSPTADLHMASAPSSYHTVLSAEEGSGVSMSMQWSQLGSRLVLGCRFQLTSGEDNVRRARVSALQINRNMFGLGVQQVFPALQLDPDEKAVDVGLIVAFNNEKRPTRDLQVAVEIEPVGVRYFLAPPIPPAFLLLPATGCEAASFVAWWKDMPTPAWTLPPQCVPVRCSPDRFTANSLRVHCINLVHRKDDLKGCSGLVGFFLFAETASRERLLVEAALQNSELVLLEVRAVNNAIAAYFGEYIHKCISALS